jgi:hypothetical protein
MIKNILVDLQSKGDTKILSLFGTKGLEHIITKLDYIVFYNKQYDVHIITQIKTSNYRKNVIDLFLEDNMESIDCNKYVLLPTEIDNENEYLNQLINSYTNIKPILLFINTDSFSRIGYDLEKYNIKIAASMPYPYSLDVKLTLDYGLSLAYFYYLNLWSLTNFNLVFDNINPKDKVFCYSKRFYDTNNSERKYWFDRMASIIPKELLHTSNLLDEPKFKNADLTLASYALASYFDYNECMFNIIHETEGVYSYNINMKESIPYKFTEKTLYSILFANPSILISQPELIKYLNDKGIVLLNNEFEAKTKTVYDVDNSVLSLRNIHADFNIMFNNFCNFIINSKIDDRVNLYNKYKKIQKHNRTQLLNYIETPKKEILEYILK